MPDVRAEKTAGFVYVTWNNHKNMHRVGSNLSKGISMKDKIILWRISKT